MLRELLKCALREAGNQENLAKLMELSAPALSKKINGDTGWYEDDLDKLAQIAGLCEKCRDQHHKQIQAFQTTLSVTLNRLQEIEQATKPLFKRQIHAEESANEK